MCGMWLMAQGVEKKNVETLQLRHGIFRDLAVVSQISSRSEAKSINLGLPMNDNDGLEAGAEQLNRPRDGVQFDLGKSAKLVLRLENVAEHAAQEFHGLRAGVERHFPRLV